LTTCTRTSLSNQKHRCPPRPSATPVFSPDRSAHHKGWSDVTRDDTVETLLELGVSHDVLKNFPSLPSDVEALLIYGSRARGDAVPGSDLTCWRW